MKRIQSKKHKIGTYKKHLSYFNNKRYILINAIRLLSYCHEDDKDEFELIQTFG